MYRRSALHLRDICTVADFYTPRNLSALAALWQMIGKVRNRRVRSALAFAFTNTAWHGTRMRRFNARGGHRPLTGTLYIPQLSSEANVFDVFGHKIDQLVRFYSSEIVSGSGQPNATVQIGSAAELDWIPDESVDYVFTDPPFGSNIFYADCNLIAESWLGVVTEVDDEAVVNRSRGVDRGGKTLQAYGAVLERAFREMYRVLKPNRWATVVFQSSDGAVWHAIEEAAARAGFTVHAANMLDKVQQSMKGYKGRSGAENVASFDIVLQLRKRTRRPIEARHVLTPQERRDLVSRVVAEHLESLPPCECTERTLPFLYSLCVRALLSAGCSANEFSMQRLRNLLNEEMEERNGYWFNELRLSRIAASSSPV
jgi:hypothetical protein